MPSALTILDRWSCPTCGHSFARRIAHCGEEESHVREETEAEAARILAEMEQAHSVPPGTYSNPQPYPRHGGPRPGAGKPRLTPGSPARISRSYRLLPATAAAIEAERRRTGESAGQVIDRLASALAHPSPGQ